MGVVYDPKVRAFLRHIGQERAIDLGAVTAEALTEAVEDAMAAASPEAQQAAMERLRTLEMENRKVLSRYLGGSSDKLT